MGTIYTHDSNEIGNFHADSLTVLEIVERLNTEIHPSFLGKKFYTDALTRCPALGKTQHFKTHIAGIP